jgi:hypothetical protein
MNNRYVVLVMKLANIAISYDAPLGAGTCGLLNDRCNLHGEDQSQREYRQVTMDDRCTVLVMRLANIVREMHKMSSIVVVGGGFFGDC